MAVHLAFVCSLRAGETAGIDIGTINLKDNSLWISQEVQRVFDDALKVIPVQEIIRVFPKNIQNSKSNLILKGPKTEGSYRKQYLATPLLQEIKERLSEIESNKAFFGKDYKDYGLLLCQPDGRPIEPVCFVKWFRDWQTANGIDEQIDIQGLRKSGQMHKVRLSQNNYQLVAENSGQSPEVLMSNYNEALDSEKRTLSKLVETSFYPQGVSAQPNKDAETMLLTIQNDPELAKQILQALLSNAISAK